MLVLSRKSGDAVVIDGDIKIKVIDVRGGVVRLGIEAPKEVPVFRDELWSGQRAPATRQQAAQRRLRLVGRQLDCRLASS